MAVGFLKHVELPDHLVGDTSGFYDVMLRLERGFVNASGNSFVSGSEVNFDAGLRD